MISVIDTHAHLDLEAYDADRIAVLDSARAAGVHAVVLIGYDPVRWKSTRRLCHQRTDLVRSVGVHPNSAGIWSEQVEADLREEASNGEAVAIGEIGLDFFRDHADPDLQRAAFRTQLRMAKSLDLPIIIHQRAAEDEVLASLIEFSPLSGVMHCFDGDSSFAQSCVDLGMHLGIGGSFTYPRSVTTREAILAVPIERLVLETDAPFLAPQRRRGTRNEPAFIHETLQMLAAVRGVSEQVIAERTTENAIKLFGLKLLAARDTGRSQSRCRS